MSNEDLEKIGRRAAELYGQDWDTIPAHSKAIWCNLINDTALTGGGSTLSERAAVQALREFNGISAPAAEEEAPQGKVDKTAAKTAPKAKK